MGRGRGSHPKNATYPKWESHLVWRKQISEQTCTNCACFLESMTEKWSRKQPERVCAKVTGCVTTVTVIRVGGFLGGLHFLESLLYNGQKVKCHRKRLSFEPDFTCSGGRGCLGEGRLEWGRLGVPQPSHGQFRRMSVPSLLHFIGKGSQFKKCLGKRLDSPRHPSSRHPRPSDLWFEPLSQTPHNHRPQTPCNLSFFPAL